MVALLIETSNEYARGIIRGIHEYIKKHTRWTIYLGEYSRGEPRPEWLLSWKGDGILARIENRDMADLIIECGLPVVDLSAANLIPDIPWVETDDQAISNLAVDHLIDCGFKSFGFVETPFNWSKWRGVQFEEKLREKGFQCHCLKIGRESKLSWEEEQKKIESWLTEIQKTIGIFYHKSIYSAAYTASRTAHQKINLLYQG